MSRFVVLIHDHPVLHWDFMLEKEATLRTWRLSRPPGAHGPIDPEPLADHRLDYLDYEGAVSGNRGTVRRFDGGEYVLIEETEDRVVAELQGTILRGTVTVECTGASGGWSFSFSPVKR